MRMLVTGGEGRIGQKLVERLKNLKHSVVFLSRKNKHSSDPYIKIVQGDLINFDTLLKATENIDLVIHLAGITHANNEKLYYSINTKGTRNLIEACEKNKVKKIIYISSRAAVANGGAYALSKLQAEEEVRKSSMNWVILRPAEVYGAGEKEAIESLIKIMQKNFFIPIIGNGRYKLAPIFVDDVVSSIIASLDSKIAKKIYIIAGPEEMSYNQLVDRILNYLRLQRVKVHIPILFFKIAAWIFSIFKKNVFVKDQIPRLTSEKSSDIHEASKDLHFLPIKFETGLEIILGKKIDEN